MAAKIVLARLPVPYAAWRRLSLFRHGEMDEPAYALQVVTRHLERAGFMGRTGFVALEIGPGDTLASMVVARALGASACYLVDVAPVARRDLEPYLDLCAFLQARGYPTPGLERARTLGELMAACNARYLTAGVESLREIPGETVDVAWSHAVLEHVQRTDLPALLCELHRVLRPGGTSSHTVDLSDHMGGALNQLRFSEAFWEGGLPARSGFYTNRVRFRELLALFERCGFDTEVTQVARWPSLPTPRRALSSPYGSMSDEELSVSGFDARLRRADPRDRRS
jgi:SAM-dependent methyltransferase